ncbi:hypothetical protein RBH26_16685 [Natronolimnohabitans sp. A-GB9]|uniref:hypothetical protein n=1 Tax=Natronolimnohabitans sp. A-GB9 TaxID=3069757 RepID=UPI0027B3CE1F|nr:hypothetical protein [Natronolimnohabitans sp. A-GB9]MDQ2052116.1 hypothetical protein [Natronolimnohabitans sp. A-GB9]
MTVPTLDGHTSRRKSTLFCWECDHSSPIDGDWVLRTRDRHIEYVCPDCETTLTRRPRRENADRDGTGDDRSTARSATP